MDSEDEDSRQHEEKRKASVKVHGSSEGEHAEV